MCRESRTSHIVDGCWILLDERSKKRGEKKREANDNFQNFSNSQVFDLNLIYLKSQENLHLHHCVSAYGVLRLNIIHNMMKRIIWHWENVDKFWLFCIVFRFSVKMMWSFRFFFSTLNQYAWFCKQFTLILTIKFLKSSLYYSIYANISPLLKMIPNEKWRIRLSLYKNGCCVAIIRDNNIKLYFLKRLKTACCLVGHSAFTKIKKSPACGDANHRSLFSHVHVKNLPFLSS